MSAEILRRAASLMRERAEAATPSPWRVVTDLDSGEQVVTGGPRGFYLADVHEWSTGLGNPGHIASWHPAVALAVADWLDMIAAVREADHHVAFQYQALVVARAYLGESA